MEQPILLLVDVSHPYRRELQAWGAENELPAVAVEHDLSAVAPDDVALCIIGLRASDPSPLERISAVKKLMRSCPIIVLGENVTVDLAVRLTRLAIADVIKLPTDPSRLIAKIGRHAGQTRRGGEVGELLGFSPAMRALREAMRDASRVLSNVLLIGETGTGKGLVARAIHDESALAESPFVHVDCALVPADATTAELVDEAGAGGTVYLDGIQDLDVGLQPKLLAILDGVTSPSPHRAIPGPRFIVSTTTDLTDRIRQGLLRPDLYFRLNVLRIEIPPLRDRLSDIPVLLDAAVEMLSQRLAIPVPEITREFTERLLRHPWPGNVRELLNVVERVLVRAPVTQLDGHLLEGLLDPLEVVQPERRSRPIETPGDASEIAAVLVATGGNISRAARRLGLARSTLRYRIRMHGLRDLIPGD